MIATRPTSQAMPGPEIYRDPAVYQREMDEIFGKSWLLVGHDSQVPRAGDFTTSFMGNDPVIMVRDRSDAIHVFLNRCRHRGNKVCLYDAGQTKSFRCAYHGWTYGLDGELAAVPLLDKAYDADFPRAELGLVEAPRVRNYHGLIFATWQADGPSLEAFLGDDLLWYLENLAFDDPDGYEILPGRHRYMIPANWKFLSENFGGDMYHFPATHASMIMLGRTGHAGPTAMNAQDEYYSVQCVGENHPPHGILQLAFGDATYAGDLQKAEGISRAAAEWVKAREERRKKRLGHLKRRPSGFFTGTIWPNFSFNAFGNAVFPHMLLLWQPRSPEATDAWQWALVERSAPPELKEYMAILNTRGQAAAGSIAPDDIDNFQRMRDVLGTAKAGKLPFNYDLGGAEKPSLMPELPGIVMEQMNERYQRAFYRYWMKVMGEESG